MSSQPTSALAPRLVVSAGDAALDFYGRAFDSQPSDQSYHDGRLVNAHGLIGSTLVGIAEEGPSAELPCCSG